MDLSFERSEAAGLTDSWAILYGRRKTGKTYILRNMAKVDEYILVGREGSIWTEGKNERKLGSFEELSDHVRNGLTNGKRIAIDEFQRIPSDHLEWISSVHPSGTLILSGSSMGVMKRVLGPGSPLLGKFSEKRLGLIGAEDLFSRYPSNLGLDHAPYLSDPWTIPMMKNGPVLKELYHLISTTTYSVPSLVGEIFHEEERNLSRIYQGIMASIGSGTDRTSEIASRLYSKGLIPKDSASSISPYLDALYKMGLVDEIAIFGKKRKVLRFVSPVMTLYYYMEAKYGLEKGLPSFKDVESNLRRIHSICMEHFLVKAFSRKLGGYLRYSFEPEIDGIVVDRKERPVAMIEVKWKDLRRSDVESFLQKTEDMDAPKYIITRRIPRVKVDGAEIMDERTTLSFLGS